ncbi:MAG TPA: MaoC family dehydratase [Candidatus Binataceae bacterium]|nr:MaoC family dehydratase [Candidatus Binataceae bacterium]
MSITSDGSYFEDFNVGETLAHQRGRTITEADNHIFTSLVMNTAELHFNQDMVDKDPTTYYNGRLVVYGGVVLAFTVGLASEDTSENAIAEVEMDNGRHTNPVFHGDTLYAESTVLEKRDSDRTDAGLVKFKLVGKKPDGTVVVEIERTVLIKRKSHYLKNA